MSAVTNATLCELNMDNPGGPEDLLDELNKTKKKFTELLLEKSELQSKVESLENKLKTRDELFREVEEERSLLKSSIKKASASWFERKARISESESESHSNALTRQNSGVAEIGIQVLVPIYFTNPIEKTTEEVAELITELKYKTSQLELSERRCCDLRKRLRDYERVIEDQEFIIHGLQEQLDTYFNDNQNMSQQLADLSRLFEELEVIDQTKVTVANAVDGDTTIPANQTLEEDVKSIEGSVSKTYLKLKELIYEKKSLVTEIERLKTLNVELQRRVTEHEARLLSVSDALHTTWLLVSDLKEQHAKLHSAESLLRYELKEKREILQRLKKELELSREQWHYIRQKNSESEQEWNSIREELDERRRQATQNIDGMVVTSSDLEGAVGGSSSSSNYPFEPPVDLLLDMGLEYGCVDADDEVASTVVAVVEGKDVHAVRLQNLEEQCCTLYQKLMSSTSRSLALASRLSSLHQHYGSPSDDEGEEDEYYEEEEEEVDDEQEEVDQDAHLFESQMTSPDPESYDTAYVSEPDTGSASGVPGTLSEEETPMISNQDCLRHREEGSGNDSPELEDGCDVLSRRLINFLPRKIEILRAENKKLEEQYTSLQDEKLKVESTLTASLEAERRLRRQLEDQLSTLGKCVDELKLERNGKIEAAEKELKDKVAHLDAEEERLAQKEVAHDQLQEELETLREKFEERGQLLRIASDQLIKVEAEMHQSQEKLEERNDQFLAVSNRLAELQERIKSIEKAQESRLEHVPTVESGCQTTLTAEPLEPDINTESSIQVNSALCQGDETNRDAHAEPNYV